MRLIFGFYTNLYLILEKIISMKTLYTIALLNICSFFAFAQQENWNNGGGNPSRNGFVSINGPTQDSVLWETNSGGLFGMPGYIEGNNYVTMRYYSGSYSPIECYDVTNGTLLWQRDITELTARSLPVGLRDDQIYAVKLTDNLSDTLYALDVATGNTLWTSNVTVAPNITASVTFAPNGDFFIERFYEMCRINHSTGEAIWQTDVIPQVLGHCELSVFGNTGYFVQLVDGLVSVSALDIETGLVKYSKALTDTHPGGPLQQCQIMVGNNGVIYAQKQADNITALEDDGESLNILWETEIFGSAPFSSTCIGADSNIYVPSFGKILKLDYQTGAKIDSSLGISSTPDLFQLRVSATQNNLIFATNGQNILYAFNTDLDILWTDVITGVNNSGATISANGLVAVSGANIIKVYTPSATTELEEHNRIFDFDFYPNPANNKLNIKFDKPNFIGSLYKIYDEAGRVMATGKFLNKSSVLDLGNFPTGNYLVKIGGNKKHTFKFIKE